MIPTCPSQASSNKLHHRTLCFFTPRHPGGSAGKESACNAGDLGLIPGLGRSAAGENGTPVFLPGEFHGQRTLAGHSPWGHRGSDMNEVT